MNKQQSALAFGRAYELFSKIYRHGLNDDIIAILGASMPNIAKSAFDSQYAAEHYQLLIHNVYPYESIFLGEDGLLGGSITDSTVEFYHQIGFHALSDESADHISKELDAMAFLCFAELDAIEDDVPHQIERIRHLQRRLLDEHLLRWMPIFAISLQKQNNENYAAVALQSLALVCSHRQALGEDLMATTAAFVLPTAPDLLNDEKTSLRDIARYLLTPAYTGFFLSIDNIKQIAAQYRVPRGFGKRQQVLINLLRTASDYDVFPQIIRTFKAYAESYKQQLITIENLPSKVLNVWLQQLEKTIALLVAIEKAASENNISFEDEEIEEAILHGQSTTGCEVAKDKPNGPAC